MHRNQCTPAQYGVHYHGGKTHTLRLLDEPVLM